MASTRRLAAILAADVAGYDIVRRSWTESSQTPSWRGMDSNFQFRDAAPTARATSGFDVG